MYNIRKMTYFFLKLSEISKISWWKERPENAETFNQLLVLQWEKNTLLLVYKSRNLLRKAVQCFIFNDYKARIHLLVLIFATNI